MLARKASGYIGELPEDDAAADAGTSPAKPDPGARGGSRAAARAMETVVRSRRAGRVDASPRGGRVCSRGKQSEIPAAD